MESRGPAPTAALTSESLTPAPYGRACIGCSRAKCKCFYRADGSGCERCHRLSKTCELPVTARKRKAQNNSPGLSASIPSRDTLEEKLEDIVSLLRSQVTTSKESQSSSPLEIPLRSSTKKALRPSRSEPSTPVGHPDFVVDTQDSYLGLVRPEESAPGMGPCSPLQNDVAGHYVPDAEADERLERFRNAFLNTFPFAHIPPEMRSLELRLQKPFLWFVIMTLTDPMVARQFVMEETIWKIISQRIVVEHHADLDALIAIICFCNWSHHFKKDRPFMDKLTHIAISIATELDLHKRLPSASQQQAYTKSRITSRQFTRQQERTLEERRSYIALVKLTSTTWETYRKTEPLSRTSYIDECLRILGEGTETQLDTFLATQTNCQLLTNETILPFGQDWDDCDGIKTLPKALLITALRNLEDMKRGLPQELQSMWSLRICFHTAELKIRDRYLFLREKREKQDQMQVLQDLEATLCCVERWLEVISDMPLFEMVGISVDISSQLMHCMIVLFKLTTINEPFWDISEVRKRADVLAILEHYRQSMYQLTVAAGMVDADGPRRGIFFKGPELMGTLCSMLAREIASKVPPVSTLSSGPGDSGSGDMANGFPFNAQFQDGAFVELENEPWLSDLFDHWDLGFETINGTA